MALPVANNPFYTYEEYLALEQANKEVRYEYHRGEVLATSGTTKVHNRMVRNLANLLDNHFLPQGCNVYAQSVKVEIAAGEIYCYPDVVVTRSERDRKNARCIQDPGLIGEVLWDGKHNIDLKLAHYTRIPTLQVFILVSGQQHLLHVYERRTNKWWYRAVLGEDQQVHLAYFDLTMPVADVYQHVRLNETTGGDEGNGAVGA
jgi:Uma2 family endonuclease